MRAAERPIVLGDAGVGGPGAIACEAADKALVVPLGSLAQIVESAEFAVKIAFSIELWFRPDPGKSDVASRLFSHEVVQPGGETTGYLIAYDDKVVGGPFLYFSRYYGDNNPEEISVVLEGPPSYRHVVGTFDGATMLLFGNGTKRGTLAVTRNLAATDAGTLLGARHGSVNPYDSFFSGRIDEVAIYNFALPEERIKAHFAAAR